MVLDIDKICRLCLELSSNSIFNSETSIGHQTALNSDLISRIFECTALKVAAGDGLPESICESCIRLVDKFFLFRKMCWEVDSKLRCYVFTDKGGDLDQTSVPNPVRLDPDQIELIIEPKDSWMCNDVPIKGEQETSEDDTANGDGNDYDIDESDEEYLPRRAKSASKTSKEKYSCDICSESFRKLSELKSHKEEEHPPTKKQKRIMTCKYCSKEFKQLKRYNDHIKSHEEPEEGEDEDEENGKTADNSETESQSQKSNAQDESSDGNSQSQKCGEDSTGRRRRKFRKVYDCEYCDQVFHSYAKYTLHELIHTGEKKYNCSDCSRSFTHKHSLIGHIKEQHTGEVNFTCDVCGRGFVHQSTFNIHKKTHSTEKPLKCPDCGKCFTQMKNLRVHRQIHSASRTHTCQVCGKSFNFMKTLKVHLVLHSGEKPYVCTYCGKAFAQSAPLKTHTRIHTGEKPYQCTICPLRFSTNNAMKSHVLKHSGEAPYSCEVCNKGFTRKKDKVAHQEETHTVYIGLPGQENNISLIHPQNNIQNNSIVQQQNSMPPSVHSLPTMLIVPDLDDHLSTHMVTNQTPPPLAPLSVSQLSHVITPQHHPHLTHTSTQLHPMVHHARPPHVAQPPQNCMTTFTSSPPC